MIKRVPEKQFSRWVGHARIEICLKFDGMISVRPDIFIALRELPCNSYLCEIRRIEVGPVPSSGNADTIAFFRLDLPDKFGIEPKSVDPKVSKFTRVLHGAIHNSTDGIHNLGPAISESSVESKG